MFHPTLQFPLSIQLLICFLYFSSVSKVIPSPYRKAVFVQISDEYAANILQTALFTVIVRRDVTIHQTIDISQ